MQTSVAICMINKTLQRDFVQQQLSLLSEMITE